MTKFSTTFASIATLALAAVPAFAIATGAHAAPVAVKVSDLNLGTAEGAKELDRRIDAAADRFCARQQPATGTRLRGQSCKTSVRAEIMEKVAAMKTSPSSYAAR